MATIVNTIKYVSNMAEYRAEMEKGLVQTVAITSAAEKMAKSLGGENLLKSAQTYVAAVEKMGGVEKLTHAERERGNVLLTKALEKYEALGLKAPPAMIALAKATEQAEAPTAGLSTKLIAVGAAIGSFIGNLAADAFKRIASGLVDIASNGIKLAPTVTAFENLTKATGQSGDEMLRVSRTASKGLISDLDLMQAANKGLLLGLPITSQSLGTMATTAVVLGKAMGQGPVKSFDDLITALGRSSPMILDNLGLSVKVGEANEVYAKSVGKTAEQLTDAEKKLAFYNAAMTAAEKKVAELGGVQLTLADRVAQVKVGFKNFTDGLGVAIATSPVVNAAFGTMADAISGAMGENQTVMVQRLVGVVNRLAIAVVDMGAVGIEGARSLGNAWFGLNAIFSGVSMTIGKEAIKLLAHLDVIATVGSKLPGDIGRAFTDMRGKIIIATREIAGASGSFKKDMDASLDSAAQFNKGIDTTSKTLGTMKAAMVAAANQQVSSAVIAEQLAKKTTETGTAAADSAKQHEGFKKKLGELNTEISNALKTYGLTNEVVAKYGKAAADAAFEAKAWGDTASANVTRVAEAWRKAQLHDEMLKSAKASKELREDFEKSFKAFNQQQLASMDASTKAIVANLKLRQDAEKAVLDEGSRLTQAKLTAELEALKRHGATTKEIVGQQVRIAEAAYQADVAALKRSTEEKLRAVNRNVPGWEAAYEQIEAVTAERMETVKTIHNAKVAEMRDKIPTLAHTFQEVLDGIPKLLTAAFTGGGNFMGALKALVSQIGSTIGSAIGASFGPLGEKIGGAIGSLAGPALEGLKKVFDVTKGWIAGPLGALTSWFMGQQEHKKVNDMRDAFIGAAGGLHELNVKAVAAGTTLDALLRAKKVKDFEAAVADLQKKLGDFTASAEADNQRLTAAMQTYGLSWENAGIKMRQAEIDRQAKELIEDFRVLVKVGGFEVSDVLLGMTDKVNEFIASAIRTGTEIPAAMRPMLEKMVEMGKLTDENGVALTDLSKLTFAETLTQGFDRVVGAIDRLIGTIGGLPGAASTAAAGVTSALGTIQAPKIFIPVEFDVPDFPTGGSPTSFHNGGIVSAQRFHAGTAKVLPFHRFHHGLAPDEVPAILQTGEAVLNRRAASALGPATIHALNRGGERRAGAAGTTEQTIVIALDSREIGRKVVRGMPRELRVHGVAV